MNNQLAELREYLLFLLHSVFNFPEIHSDKFLSQSLL
jgi:hypothetical protein